MTPAFRAFAALSLLLAAPGARADGPSCTHEGVDGHVCHRGIVCRCSENHGGLGPGGGHVWFCSPALGRCSDGSQSIAWAEIYLDTPLAQKAAREALARGWGAGQAGSPPADTLDRQDIARLQRRLNTLGLDAGPADGIVGPGTRTAIRIYQERKGYVVDGIASPELLATFE